MKHILILLAFTLLAGSGFSQNVDSLQTVSTVDSLLSAATGLWRAEKNQEALPLAQQATDISKHKWGENNVKYAASLHRLASIYTDIGQTDEGETLYLHTIELRAKLLGKEHLDYSRSLINLGALYYSKGDFAKAEIQYLEAKEVFSKKLDTEPLDYALCLNNLGGLYLAKGDYTKAELYCLQAREIWVKNLGTEHPQYALSLNTIGVLYYRKGDYSKAELYYLEAKEIWAKTLGKTHTNYAACLGNMANLYQQKGDYVKAETLYLEAIQIRKITQGKENPDYATSLSELATLYREKGDYIKAEALYLEGIETYAKTLGKETSTYANFLIEFANLFTLTGDYTKAKPLYMAGMETFAKTLGKEHIKYANFLNNIGTMYYFEKDYAKAEQAWLEAKKIIEKLLGKESSNYAHYLSNLSVIEVDKGDYAKAKQMALEAKDIREKVLGKENPNYIASLNNLIFIYEQTQQVATAINLLLEKNDLIHRLIKKSADYSSESQMFAYLTTFNKDISICQSFAQTHSSPETSRLSFENALLFKGFLLENSRHISRAVASSDSITRDIYERWQGCRRRLANEYAKPVAERRYVAEVEAEAEGYEKTLIHNLPTFSDSRRVPHWQEIQSTLKSDEAVIEFIHYRYYGFKKTDSIMYAALLLRPGDIQPQFIALFEEKEISSLLRGASGGSNFLKINALYTSKTADSKQKTLYDLIWQPLEGLLSDTKTIYCSPSGLLHRINLAAIPTNDRQAFGQRHQLVLLGSTRQLVVPNATTINSTNDAYLAGGIRYDADSTAITQAIKNASLRSIDLLEDLVFQTDSTYAVRTGVLDYLPATAAEVRQIGQILGTSGISVKVDTGFYATEEAFRQLGAGKPSPRILHLATHGYFFPDPEDKAQKIFSTIGLESVFRMSEHPMIRSGLIMAGAKQAWLTGRHPEGLEDGILTSYEISRMDLSGTELVVLSACETALGDIAGNEGVYGLQRAFKIAGAKYLIMSLWKVDDRSTQEFMTAFYRHWLAEKTSIPEAFRTAQQEMKTKYPSAYDWAGFVLIE